MNEGIIQEGQKKREPTLTVETVVAPQSVAKQSGQVKGFSNHFQVSD